MRRGSQMRATSYFLAAVALAIVLLSLAQSVPIDGVRGVVATAFEPVQAVLASTGGGVRGAISTVLSIADTASENARLKGQVGDLQRQLDSLRAESETSRQLKLSLGLRDTLQIHSLAAQVIGLDPEKLSQAMTIHAGARQGVRKGMAVLGQLGLVGRVLAVQSNSSQVRLISDPQSPVNVELSTSHLSGTVRVIQGKMMVEILGAPPALKIAPGEVLVTSGLGGNFPKGLPVAEVVKFQYQAYGATQVAEVAPVDNLGRLEYVLVDTDFVPDEASS